MFVLCLSASAQTLPMHSPLACHQIRNSLKTDEPVKHLYFLASFHASIASQHRHEPRPATFDHTQPAYGYSSMQASAALRCQSN